MEHLTQAIEKLARNATRSFLGDLLGYLESGDEKILRRLLKLGEADMNWLNPVAKAVARPDRFEEGDRRLVRFFARRSALLKGVDKRDHMGSRSDQESFGKSHSTPCNGIPKNYAI